MKNQELYNKTVDILVQAYLNDTLEHTNCQACAVGNIVAANTGLTLVRAEERLNSVYPIGFNGSDNPKINSGLWFNAIYWGEVFDSNITPDIQKQIDATGYSAKELAMIEEAFESAEGALYGFKSDLWMFNGLMAVIDVLDAIHENTDSIITANQKSRFTKTCAL